MPEKSEPAYNDTARMPWSMNLEDDTGYFKGLIPEPIVRFEEFEDNRLGQGLTGLLNQENIQLLDSETLSHSVFIDPVKKIQRDTMRNKSTTIISSIYKGKGEWQKVTLNGRTVVDYSWNGTEGEEYGPMMDFDPSSFRHFSFHGKEYYLILANEAFTFGGSARNISYYYIWNEKLQLVGLFQSCRFEKKLLGDANGDQILDFLEFDNSDFCTTVPGSDKVTIRLWSVNPEGNFAIQKDPAGTPWFIEAKTGDNLSQDSLNIIRSHWPKSLK
ncbi:MAG: hypothetical protein ABL876_06905 [Chitinophagaceae bacterium]